MARYRVLATSFINDTIAQEGAIVDVNDDPADGGMTPGSNLVKVADVDEAKPRGKKKVEEDLA
jgi:hypothetical protein